MTTSLQGSEPEHTQESCHVLVLQNGARHNYAIPLELAREKMLAGFYTDACGNVGLGHIARFLTHLPRLGPAFRRLASRRVPAEVAPLTRSFPQASLSELLDPSQRHPQPDRWYAGSMERAGRRNANLIYSSLGWAPAFLARSRSLGIPVVTEFYVRPSLWRVHQEEHRNFPEWEESLPYAELTDTASACQRILDVSDHLIVPGGPVKQDIIDESLFPEDRIHIVPYGIGDAFFDIQNQPVPGNILFVGIAGLMKGIHYLAQASHLLANTVQEPTPRFIVAGDVTDRIRSHPLCSKLEFLGRVPRAEVTQLYEKADVLVFPTLSDSFGAVVLEAMAARVPVICSPYCTDAVQDGVSGFVVNPRDPQALAEAIRGVITDRALRQRLSEAARKRASEFTWDHHQQRLARLLRNLATGAAADHRSNLA